MPNARDILADLTVRLTPLGVFRAKAIFGGYGLYIEDCIFGLLAYDRLYLKADTLNRADFEKAGSLPFSYETRMGKRIIASYWQCPDRIYKNQKKLLEWVSASLEASRRSKAGGKT